MSTAEEKQPVPITWAVCQSLTKAGRPCRAPATGNGTLCPQHAATPEQRKIWGTRGSLATQHKHLVRRIEAVSLPGEPPPFKVPDLSTTVAVERFLAETTGRVLAGLLPPSLSNAIDALLQTRLKLVMLQIDQDSLELEQKMANRPAQPAFRLLP